MKNILILFSNFIFCINAFSQDNIKLTLTKDARTKGLSNTDTYICNSQMNAEGDSIFNKYQGEILDITKDSIILYPWITSQTTFFKDDRTLETTKIYSENKVTKISIDIKSVNEVISESTVGSNIFLCAAFVSASVAGIVAPLASINYKDKTFDSRNYAKINGVSSAAFMPLLIFSLSLDQKIYHISSGKNRWVIVR